jgi:hypothetical protein
VDPRAGLDDMEKWKFFTLPGLELPLTLVVQSVASRYTDWSILAPFRYQPVTNYLNVLFLKFSTSPNTSQAVLVSTLSSKFYKSENLI